MHHTQHVDYLTVGIDLGTSNSVCAVCDSRSKKVSVLECGDDPRNLRIFCPAWSDITRAGLASSGPERWTISTSM